MPSRFEPCGLNQMYSQRYGTPPIAHATGGLCDSIVDCTPATLAGGTATGSSSASHRGRSRRGGRARDRRLPRPRDVAGAATERDGARFGWSAGAQRYAELYRSLVEAGRRS